MAKKDNDRAIRDILDRLQRGEISAITLGGANIITFTPGDISFYQDADFRDQLVFSSTRSLQLGTSASSSNGLTAGDVLVGGKLEVDDEAYFNSTIDCGIVNSNDTVAFVNETLDAFTVYVDPATGTDPSVPIVINSQAKATAYGAFETIAAAINSLPTNLLHVVTISLADGTHQLDNDYFGNLARFNFVYSTTTAGSLIIRGENWTIAAGTTTYTVQSTVATTGVVVLNADPGFVADTYRGYLLLGMSGTGSGSYRPIRTHTGANWEVAGDSPFGIGSVVSIVSPAAIVKSPSSTSQRLTLNPQTSNMSYNAMAFYKFDLVPHPTKTTQAATFIHGGILFGEGFRAVQTPLVFYGAQLGYDCCIIMTVTSPSPYVILLSDKSHMVQYYGYSRPLFAYNAGATTIIAQYGSTISMTDGHVTDGAATTSAINIFGNGSFFYFSNSFGYYNRCNTKYAIKLRAGGSAMTLTALSSWTSSGFRGTTADILIDGTEIDFSEVDADSTDSVIGQEGSFFTKTTGITS